MTASPRWLQCAACMTLTACALLVSGRTHAADAAGAGSAASATANATGNTAASPGIAPAERLLFLSTHLKGVQPQTELDYALDRTGAPAKQKDMVKVLVLSADNANGDARITDHAGKVELSGEGLPCNPVILYFLEHDIAEMEQLTGGQRRYFQRRVRLALAASPAITPVVRDAQGKKVSARQIVIQPYLDDPNSARFAQYIAKRYTFVMSDAVPGQVLLIRTEVPGSNNDFAHPVQSETLSYQGALRSLSPAPGQKIPDKAVNAPRASR
jgi:hypothetical protein